MAVKKKMNVVFKDEEEYQKYRSGKTHSNKGLRNEDGKLSSLPDIEELDEDLSTQDIQVKVPSIGEQILYSVLEGLIEATKEILSDEENRKAIATLARNWWIGKALPGIRKSADNVKYFVHGVKTGETKVTTIVESKKNKENSSIIVKNDITGNKDKSQKNKVSAEEYEQQIKQVQVLAVLLADRIKKLSNSVIDENHITEEEYIIQQHEIKELTTEDVINTIKLLVNTEGFSLDNPKKQLFSEFIVGNLIVNNECIPIKTIDERRKTIKDHRL